MKLAIAIGLLILLAVGGFMLGTNPAAAPVEQETEGAETEVESQTNESTGSDEATSDQAPESVDVAVEADLEVAVEDVADRSFTLDSFNYGYSEEVIRVPLGTEVTINLTNSQGFHDWVVDEFGAATAKISAGGETSVTFVADQTGSFEYYCSVGNHRAQGMVGTLIVE